MQGVQPSLTEMSDMKDREQSAGLTTIGTSDVFVESSRYLVSDLWKERVQFLGKVVTDQLHMPRFIGDPKTHSIL